MEELSTLKPSRSIKICGMIGTIIYAFLCGSSLISLALRLNTAEINWQLIIIVLLMNMHTILCFLTLLKNYYFWRKLRLYFSMTLFLHIVVTILDIYTYAYFYYNLEESSDNSFLEVSSIFGIIFSGIELLFFSLATIPIIYLFRMSLEDKSDEGCVKVE